MPKTDEGHRSQIPVLTHEWHHCRHHSPNGYSNIWKDNVPEFSVFAVLKWIVGHLLQRKERIPPPVVRLDPEMIAAPPVRLRVVWIGHSTLLIQTPELNILTDPMFSRRASPFSFIGPKRRAMLPIGIDELPRIDVVLLSHNHYDHCDRRTMRTLFERFDPLTLVPLGLKRLMEQWNGGRVVELDWWQCVEFDGLRFHAAPARHFSGRWLRDRDRTLWTSWYVEGIESDVRLYFAGDSGYAGHFAEIRNHFGAPEVAMLPIGAYLPRWFMEPVHMDPAEAVRAFLDLEAGHFVPIHWGLFDLADEPLAEPIELTRRYCAEAGVCERLHELPIGGIVSL